MPVSETFSLPFKSPNISMVNPSSSTSHKYNCRSIIMRQQEKAFQLWDRAMKENQKAQEKLRRLGSKEDNSAADNDDDFNASTTDVSSDGVEHMVEPHLATPRSARGERYWQSKLDDMLGSSESSLKYDYEDYSVDVEALNDDDKPEEAKQATVKESAATGAHRNRPGGLLKELSTKSLSTRGSFSVPSSDNCNSMAAGLGSNGNNMSGRTLLRSLSGLRSSLTKTAAAAAAVAASIAADEENKSPIPRGSGHRSFSRSSFSIVDTQNNSSRNVYGQPASRRRGSYSDKINGGSSHHRRINNSSMSSLNSSNNTSSHHRRGTSSLNNSSHHARNRQIQMNLAAAAATSTTTATAAAICVQTEWDRQDDPRCKDGNVMVRNYNHKKMERAASLRNSFTTPMKSPAVAGAARPGLTDAQLMTFQMSLKSLLDGLDHEDDDEDDASDNDDDDDEASMAQG